MKYSTKSTMAIVSFFMLIFSTTSFADSNIYENLPPLQTLDGNTSISHDVFKDDIGMPITGLYEREVILSNSSKDQTDLRTVKIYIPDGTEAGAYLVVVAVPSGVNTLEWLSESGWIASADAHKYCLYVLEPINSQWQTKDLELAYIDQAYNDIANKRGKHYLFMPTYYLVGYGEGGALLQQYAMKKPITVAAAAFVDTSNISNSFINEMANANYPNSDIKYSQIPMPVMLLTSEDSTNYQSILSYWKHANKTSMISKPFLEGEVFNQLPDTLSQFTPESCSSVASIIGYKNDDLSEKIYENFLSKYSRYGSAVGGNTLGFRPDYAQLNVTFKTLYIGGIKRTYMIYVPESITEQDELYPAVYLFHGSQQTHKMMFDITRAWELADRENFILVLGQSLSDVNNMRWPAWDSSRVEESNHDLAYLEALLEDTTKNYPIDANRLYATGHSNGGMFVETIGLNMSEYFAALSVTSGPFLDGPVNYETESIQKERVPFYMSFGEFDIWPYDFTTSTSVKNTLNYWVERNTNQALEDYTKVDFERFENYVWSADNTPVVRYNVTHGRGHSIIPKEYELMWDEWFSKWQKNENGENIFIDANLR